MELEHTQRMFTLDESLQEHLTALTAEGWTLIPGVMPVGVYHLCRVKGAQQGQKPIAKVAIDDSKVFIHRDGKLIDKDGNVVPA